MTLETFNPSAVHSTTGYSHAVRMGDLIFVSGQVAMTPAGEMVGKGDIRAQSLDRIGKITVLAMRLEDRAVIGEIRNRIFAQFGYVPASTFAVVASLANPDWLVEIEAVAAVR
jgi:enamine deaminase RidA (YjgF/YER057c/UK114 family)